MEIDDRFLGAFKGGFTGILRWWQLDELWQSVREDSEGGWYVYVVGERPPDEPASNQQLLHFLDEVNQRLRANHDEEYCGIVYTNNRNRPTFIKIYDPKNLGIVCGPSDNPPLPGWILSKLKPIDLPVALTPTQKQKHWWRRILDYWSSD